MPSLLEAAQARRFTGKVALVVGVGSGTGRATALRLGLEGAKVVVVARSAPHVQEGEAELRRRGVDCVAVRADVSKAEGAAAAVTAAIERFGGIDVVVSTAGGYEGGGIDQTDGAALERMLDCNLRTAFETAKAAAPSLVARGGGAIVVTTAVFGAEIPGAGLLAYNVSKSAAHGFVLSLAADLAPHNVRVNAVLPGGIAHHFDPERDVSAGRRLAKGPSQPEDVAAAVVFLASDEACYVTGATLIVDGGFSVSRKL